VAQLVEVATPSGQPLASALSVHGLDGNLYSTWHFANVLATVLAEPKLGPGPVGIVVGHAVRCAHNLLGEESTKAMAVENQLQPISLVASKR
jgi:hypothetical protein